MNVETNRVGSLPEDELPVPAVTSSRSDDELGDLDLRDELVDDDAAAPRRVRRSSGRRADRRRRRRRRRLVGWVAVAGVATAAVFGVVQSGLLDGDDRTPEPSASTPSTAVVGEDPQPSLVLVTHDEAAPDGPATLVTVLSYDVARQRGTVLLVPTALLVDVPGHGMLPLGQAFEFGQAPLLDATLDNLLGVDLDHVVPLSRQGWSSLLTRVGSLTVTVSEELEDAGSGQPLFLPGEQTLPGPRLAELLTLREPGEPELSRLPRVQVVLEAFLEALGEDPALLDAVFVDDAPMLATAAPPDFVRGLFDALADAASDDALTTLTLPVSPIGTAQDDTYRLDVARTRELVAERYGASSASAEGQPVRDLQILNGNGAPGIGQDAAQLVIPAGFRVVLTGNADRFDHRATRIIVHGDDEAHLEAGNRLRELLGVGEVEIGRTPQSVVDVTIVLGLDFLAQG